MKKTLFSIEPSNIIAWYFIISMLISAVLPWLNLSINILPVVCGGYHAIFWVMFGWYSSKYYRLN